MNKIFSLMTLLVIVWFSSASAQTNVPENVKTEFKNLYPKVKKVDWVMEDGNHLAIFTSDKKEMAVQMNDKGKLIQTETRLEISELPKSAQDYLTKNYPGVKFERASEVLDEEKVKRYKAETREKTVVFDAQGNFLGDSAKSGW